MLEYEDIVQTGRLIAYDLAQRYDPDKGSSFAVWLGLNLPRRLVEVFYPYRERGRRSLPPTAEATSLDALREDFGYDVRDTVDVSTEVVAAVDIDTMFPMLWVGLDDRERALMGRLVRQGFGNGALAATGNEFGLTEGRMSQILKGMRVKVLAAVA